MEFKYISYIGLAIIVAGYYATYSKYQAAEEKAAREAAKVAEYALQIEDMNRQAASIAEELKSREQTISDLNIQLKNNKKKFREVLNNDKESNMWGNANVPGNVSDMLRMFEAINSTGYTPDRQCSDK